jgi:hypothetical protein
VRRRVASVAVALLLVLSASSGALGPASVGTAQAVDVNIDTSDCSATDYLAHLVSFQLANRDKCGTDFSFNEQDFSNTTRADLLAGASSINQSAEGIDAATNNRLTDARGQAATEAKVAIVNALNNGSNRSVARQQGLDAVSDYYATIQKNRLAQWQNGVSYASYVREVETQETGTNGTWMVPTRPRDGLTVSWVDTANATVTYLNGSTGNYEMPVIDTNNGNRLLTPVNSGNLSNTSFTETGDTMSNYNLVVVGPDGNNATVARTTIESTVLPKIYQQHTQVRNNIDTYVDGIYDYYAPGEIDATDVLGPTELYNRASLDYNSTGFNGFAAVQLASLGYSGDMNTSHVIQTDASNLDGINGSGTETVSGQLFYTGDESVTLETGKTYDPGNYSGGFVIAYQTENGSGIADLNGQFEILETTNTKTGETVQNTTTEKYVYETTNSSELKQEIERLKDLRERLQEQESNTGTPINLGTDDKAIIGVIAVAVILLLTRD